MIHVQPSTHSAATTPVRIDIHISGFDQGWSSTTRCTCQPINANVVVSARAPATRQGAIGRSATDGLERTGALGWPCCDDGDGATLVHARPDSTLADGADVTAILAVLGAADAAGPTGGGMFAPAVEDPTVPCRRHRPAG